jgi:hypothetical protein
MDDELLEIGSRRVSKTAYTLFAGEAPVHVTVLREELETLRVHGIVSDAMLEAARGMNAASRGLALVELAQLAASFAGALEALALEALSEDEESLVAQGIEALADDAARLLELHEPSAHPELTARLAGAAARNVLVTTPPADA